MGYGLNLQYGGSILVWFGLTWKLSGYEQFNARLLGGLRGEGRHITIHRLITARTTDEVTRASLEFKITTQEGLKEALNEYRRTKYS